MSRFLLNKWANGPKFEANFAIKFFWGVILLFFDKIWPKFQMPWKSGRNWPKFDNKKPFLLSKNFFWKISLSNYLFQVGIWTMPCPDKNSVARNPFMFIGFMQLQCWSSWKHWKHYIMQLPWKYHSPAATLFTWELGCLIFMEGKKSYGGSTSCVLRVPTRTVATVGQHICLHTPQLITLTWIIQFYCFLKMVVSCFPSNAGLCSLICSTSSSSSSRVVLV